MYNFPDSSIIKAIQAFILSFEPYHNEIITPTVLTDGMVFASILSTVPNINPKPSRIINKSVSYFQKVRNMEKLLQLVEKHVEQRQKKGLKTTDIDLVSLCKQESMKQIIKMFEVVIAVLMQSQNKEDYISYILALDQEDQKVFVSIVQTAMEKRICSLEQVSSDRVTQAMQRLEGENEQLRGKIEILLQQKEVLEERISAYENELDQLELSNKSKQVESLDELSMQNEKYAAALSSLKNKMLGLTREHELQLSALRQQNSVLKDKSCRLQQAEELMEVYKMKYGEAVQYMGRINVWERQKAKLEKCLSQKYLVVRKLQEKVQEITQKNLNLEESNLNLRMQLERREVQLQELKKEVKEKLLMPQQTLQILQPVNGKENLLDLEEAEQKEQLRRQLRGLEKKMRELQKENNKYAKKYEAYNALEKQMSKMKEIIFQMQERSSEEMNIMVAALYETQKQYGYTFRTFLRK